MYEPLVGAAAHALAAVLDRVRHGAIPASVQWDASVQQAAILAANVAGKPDSWPAYRAALHRGTRRRSQIARAGRARPRMGRQVAVLVDWPLAPHAVALAVAVAIDFAVGDPEYPLHPVRLIGRSLQAIESGSAAARRHGYGGGIALFLLLAVIWVAGVSGVVMSAVCARTVVRLGSARVRALQLSRARRSAASWPRHRARRRPRRARRRPAACLEAGRPRHRSDGRCRVPPRRGREPEREPHRRVHERALLVRHRRVTAAHVVQGCEHDGFDGRIPDAPLHPVRLVRRQAGRCDELRARRD